MGIFEELSGVAGSAVEELQEATGSPDAKSMDNNVHTISGLSRDKHFASDKKLERYWDLYRNVPIIREPIRAFASEVVSDGYFVESENEEAREDLEEWLENSAILSGKKKSNFRNLLKKATIQREVKGTILVEKVSDEEGDLYGFKLIRPETVDAYTKPGQAILLDPDEDAEELDEKGLNYHVTEQGEIAAYAQNTSGGKKSNPDALFTSDQVIKLERDADVGEIFGESRLAAIEDRLESLLKKLEDNDKAIESLAHPLQIFKFGTGDQGPWEKDEMRNFMKDHDPEDFEPGMKQAVQGDVEVDTVSGEVAPINEFLQFDINWIISEMPLPKYALGGFEEDVNQFVSRSQETRVEEQIKEARQEIEDEWTPVLKEKADELGYNKEDVELVIGTPPEQLGLEDIKPEEEDGQNQGASGTDFTRPPASTEEDRQENEEEEEEMFGISDSVQVEELAAFEGTEIEKETQELANTTSTSLSFVRDRLLEKLDHYSDSRRAITAISETQDRVIQSELDRLFRNPDTSTSVKVFSSVLDETIEELEDQGVDVSPSSVSFAEQELINLYHEGYVDQVENAARDVAQTVLRVSRSELSSGGDMEKVRERVMDQYSDNKLENRSNIIAHMELHEARQKVKLSKLQEADNVVGVEVNHPGVPSGSLTQSLSGAEAYFDEGSVSEQLMDQTPEQYLTEGFDPLPDTPPFRYGDRSELTPIFKEE